MSLCTLLLMSALVKPRPMPFMMSVQAWSFNPYSVYEAVERASEAGSKNIEFFPGQKLKPGSGSSMGLGLSESELGPELQRRCLAYALLHFYYKFWGPALPEERDSVKCNHRSTQPSASKTRRRASLSQSTVLNSPLRSRRRCQSR